MILFHNLWNRRPWGYPVPKEGEMLIGREILPTALGRVVVEARKIRPMSGFTLDELRKAAKQKLGGGGGNGGNKPGHL